MTCFRKICARWQAEEPRVKYNNPAVFNPSKKGKTTFQKTSHFAKQVNLINGEWIQADSGQTIDVINPTTGQKIGTVPKSGKAETRHAIEAAFKSWKKTSALESSKFLRNCTTSSWTIRTCWPNC